MKKTLKIVIPMAGWGTRMRPHTWSKPKPLVSVAGKASLDHLMDTFDTLPDSFNVEYIFIVGPFLGEDQIPAYIEKNYPEITAHYVVQAEMKGQSHAIYLTKEYLNGPMIMIFSDTLIETNFAFLDNEDADLVAWVKAVPDPRRFGVAVVEEGKISNLVEKPDSIENNLVLVGCYYFRESINLVTAINEQIKRNLTLKNEFFLADAVNIMIKNGAEGRTENVGAYWLDTGTIDATLDTNKALLEKIAPENRKFTSDVEIVEPVSIHPSAKIENSKIGPYVSIGADCEISDSQINDSIIEAGTKISASVLTRSLIGTQAQIHACGSENSPSHLNIGDNSYITFSA